MITSKEEAIRKIEEAKREQTLADTKKLTETIETLLKTTTSFTVSTFGYSKSALDEVTKQLIQQGYDIRVLPNYIKVS